MTSVVRRAAARLAAPGMAWAVSLAAFLLEPGCAHSPPQPPAQACVLPPPSAVIEQSEQELHQLWDLPDDPSYFAPAAPTDPALLTYLQGARARVDMDPVGLLRRQRAVFLAAASPALQAETRVSGLILEGQLGAIGPASCLDTLLLAAQARRHPLLSEPSEFAAFILRQHASNRGRLRVYFSSLARSGGRMNRPLRERVDADLRNGFRLLAHVHNHPFLFDRVIGDRSWTTAETRDDIAGAVSPSVTDLQYYGSLLEEAGLLTARVTNGFHTLVLRNDELRRLQRGAPLPTH